MFCKSLSLNKQAKKSVKECDPLDLVSTKHHCKNVMFFWLARGWLVLEKGGEWLSWLRTLCAQTADLRLEGSQGAKWETLEVIATQVQQTQLLQRAKCVRSHRANPVAVQVKLGEAVQKPVSEKLDFFIFFILIFFFLLVYNF